MAKLLHAASFTGFLALCLAAANPAAAKPPAQGAGTAAPPAAAKAPIQLVFREDWKLDPNVPNPGATEREQEHVLGPGDVSNPSLELKVYGDAKGPVTVHQTFNGEVTFAMTMLCTANCAIALRDKNNYVDLTGLARIRWRTKIGGFHFLHPIVKLADGTWLVGDRASDFSTDWTESEISIPDVRWRNLDIDAVVESRDGKWVDAPDLSKVEEIGFTDLMRGTGHGNGGGTRVDWIEVYGKPVARGPAQNSAR